MSEEAALSAPVEAQPITETLKQPEIPVGSTKRTMEHIQSDYFNACAQIGQEHFHLSALRKTQEKKEYEIEKLERKIEALTKESANLREAEEHQRIAAKVKTEQEKKKSDAIQ